MRVVTAREMTILEEHAISNMGIPDILLMENAAFAVVGECMKVIDQIKSPKITVICGSGNNGGDGLAIARQLHVRGVDVFIVYAGNEYKKTANNQLNLDIAMAFEIKIAFIHDGEDIMSAAKEVQTSDVVVDAVFGTGIHSPVRDIYIPIINMINVDSKYTIAADIPSGINADSGKVMGCAVKADVTVSFGYYKVGNIAGAGKELCGRLVLGNINLPKDVLKETYFILNDQKCLDMIPKRPVRSNKGTFGKVCILAGSENMPGAALLCSQGAYKVGCGLVNACVTRESGSSLYKNLSEAITTIIPSEDGYFCEESFGAIEPFINEMDVAVIGPGMGNNAHTAAFLEKFVNSVHIPVVADADALNILSAHRHLLESIGEKNWVFTPHPKEMERLSGVPVDEILADPLNRAVQFAEIFNTAILLKDAATIIANPEGQACINTTGNQAMAKGGSGDVLAGIIGGLIAQGLDVFDAASIGAYIHGKAGDLAREQLGLYGVMASDLINYIPMAMKSLEGKVSF